MMAERPFIALAACVAALMLGACGEKPQISDRSVRKSDTAAWSVSSAAIPAYAAPGWKVSGDKALWEAQINSRTQSQNDFAAR